MAAKNTITAGTVAAPILVADPGKAGALRIQHDASAIFQVGEHVLYFRDGSVAGEYATISGQYQLCGVISSDGPYLISDGRRAEYRFGYGITLCESGKSTFAAAHELTRDDLKQSHLRLVPSRTASAF